MRTQHRYSDIAIILAWPDTTIRGDEKWMMFFKKIGLVKNLNFKIGHTGIILVESDTKELMYYDFGRYIAPRGYGRARSPQSDPRLKIHTKAIVDQDDQVTNLEEIMRELVNMKDATQSDGRIFFSIATGLNFVKAKKYADDLVLQGSMPYGAFAGGNNNCSRFITRLLVHASEKYHLLHGVRYPESFKSSPMSNVVNVRPNRDIYCYDEAVDQLRRLRMNRFQSFAFMLHQLKVNFSAHQAKALPDDEIVGSVAPKNKPGNVPHMAHWLGGVGEGAWYAIKANGNPQLFEISRHTECGKLEYQETYYSNGTLDLNKPYQLAYDSHLLYTSIVQNGITVRLYPLQAEQVAMSWENSAEIAAGA